MQHVLETGKRVFSAAVAAATIAFSIGAGVLVAPSTSHAASAGDRIKSTSLSTVYYYAYDGSRYTYPNENTYKSWHMTSSGASDFSGVMTLSDSAISDITLGGNVVVRPGTYWIKITSDAKLYAVARNGMIHWIESQTVAQDLRGSDWNSHATNIDVPDVFFADYTVGTSLMSATAYEGAIYAMGGSNFLSWDGEMREVTSAGMSANGFRSMFVLDGSNIDDSALAMGADITAASTALRDVAQTVDEDVVAEGDLTVSAASSMPAGASVPQGANALEAFRFNVKGGSSAGEFNGVTLSLTGAGATTDLSNVYLYEGDVRLTESRTVNSSTRQVTFSNLGLDVSAGQTRTFTVRVTVSSSATAANTFGFKIANSADVVAGGSVGGSFPVNGNIFTVTGADVGTLTVTESGTVSNPTIGAQDAEIGYFKLTASGTEGASVQSITLKIDNAADHGDFRLYDGTVLLANGVHTSGDSVLFDLSSAFAIAEGGNNIFTVTADVGGQNGDDLKVYVDNTVDIVAVGTDYGFGLTIDTDDSNGYDGTSCTSTSGKCSFSDVQGGDITLAFNGPSAGDIQVDSQDQTLLSFSFTAAQEVTVKDLDIIVYADDDDNDPFDATDDDAGNADGDSDGLVNTGTEANLKDIKIVNAVTGAVIMGPMELDALTDAASADDADQTIDFTDDFTVEAGETLQLEVRGDIDNGVTSATEFGAALDVSGFSIEDVNGDSVTSIVPSTDITGYAQTARSASLTFALASSAADITTVQGTDGVTTMEFSVTAGAASDVTVTSFALSAYGDAANNTGFVAGGESGADVNDFVEACSLYEGSTLLSGPKSPSTNGQTFTFNSMAWTIDAGEVTKLTVKCNFANPSDTSNAYFAFDLNDADADVVAEDAEGNAVSSISGDDVNSLTTSSSVLATANNHVTLDDVGTLSVSVSTGTPTADFILSSSVNNYVSSFLFYAVYENFTVDTLTFSEEQAEDDAGSTDSSAYANNISLVTITYPKADGTTATKTAVMSGNEAKFSSMGMAVAPAAVVKVYVDAPMIDSLTGGSATSNEKVRMGLFVDTTNDDNYRAIGDGSGSTLDDDDQGAIGDDAYATDGIATFVVRRAKPTITLSSSSPSGSAVVGRNEVLRFNVAASSYDVALEDLTFKFTGTDNNGDDAVDWLDCDTDDPALAMDVSDYDLYNLTTDGTSVTLDDSSSTTHNTTLAHMNGTSANSPWTLLTSTGAMCTSTTAATAFVRVHLPTAEIIPAGSTYTFALYYDSTGASSSSDDTLRFDIATDPIASAYIEVANSTNESAIAITDTTIDVDDGTSFGVGDIIAYDETDGDSAASPSAAERMLVTSISSNTLTVVRGYLGTTPLAYASLSTTADDMYRLPASLLWQDDGAAAIATASYKERYGAYLVDNLMVNGNTLVF